MRRAEREAPPTPEQTLSFAKAIVFGAILELYRAQVGVPRPLLMAAKELLDYVPPPPTA